VKLSPFSVQRSRFRPLFDLEALGIDGKAFDKVQL